MKVGLTNTYRVLFVIVIVVLVFTGCKKEYTCACYRFTEDSSGVLTKHEFRTESVQASNLNKGIEECKKKELDLEQEGAPSGFGFGYYPEWDCYVDAAPE